MGIPKEFEGSLKPAPVDFRAAENLLKRARQDLASARFIHATDMEAGYTLLYDCMLHAALAFMAVSGVRTELMGKHKTVIRYMGHILGNAYQSQTEFYDRMRRKRHQFLYEPGLYECTEKEAAEAEKVAGEFLQLVSKKVREIHPQKELEF